MTEPFLEWGKTVVDATATLLATEIPGARRGKPSSLRDYEGVYVHFLDAHLPQEVAVWVYATRKGSRYNVRGGDDVIGVGLKQDAKVELDRAVWKYRRLPLFTWREHVDERMEGLRWLCSVHDLPQAPQAAGEEIAQRVLAALRRARAIAEAP